METHSVRRIEDDPDGIIGDTLEGTIEYKMEGRARPGRTAREDAAIRRACDRSRTRRAQRAQDCSRRYTKVCFRKGTNDDLCAHCYEILSSYRVFEDAAQKRRLLDPLDGYFIKYEYKANTNMFCNGRESCKLCRMFDKWLDEEKHDVRAERSNIKGIDLEVDVRVLTDFEVTFIVNASGAEIWFTEKNVKQWPRYCQLRFLLTICPGKCQFLQTSID